MKQITTKLKQEADSRKSIIDMLSNKIPKAFISLPLDFTLKQTKSAYEKVARDQHRLMQMAGKRLKKLKEFDFRTGDEEISYPVDANVGDLIRQFQDFGGIIEWTIYEDFKAGLMVVFTDKGVRRYHYDRIYITLSQIIRYLADEEHSDLLETNTETYYSTFRMPETGRKFQLEMNYDFWIDDCSYARFLLTPA